MSQIAQEETDAPGFRYYSGLLFRHRVPLLTFFIIVVTFASFVIFKLPNQYRAISELLFDSPDTVMAAERELATPQYAIADYIATQIQIVRSLPVIEEAVRQTKFDEHVHRSFERAVTFATANLKITQVRGTRIVRITFESKDPRVATEMANAVSEAFIKKNIENRLHFSREILNLLPEETQKTITAASPAGQLEELSKREVIESLPSVQADPTLRELKQKRTEILNELAALEKQYRQQHPLIVQKKANLKFIDESIEIETRQIVENLRTAISSRLQISNVRFIKRATVPAEPSGPPRAQLILLVVAAQLFVSCFLVMMFDRIDDRIKGQDDIERYLHLPYLGHMPLIRTGVKSNRDRALFSYLEPDSEVAEAIRYIRVGINFSAPPDMLRCMLVSSSLPQEGKSFCASNLAISMALDGNKVLLIDADSRRPTIHRLFQISNEVGLTNYLTTNISIDSAIQPSSVHDQLKIITSGPASPNPSEIFSSDRMKTLIQQVRTQYDRVIIDAPPLTGIGDGLVLGSILGHIVLVVMAGKTNRDVVSAVRKKLQESGVKIIGVVLNSLDVERERYGYYRYHYHTYRNYYGNKKK